MKLVSKKKFKKVWIAGHRGLVGSAILKLLKEKKYNLIYQTSSQLDLRNKNKVFNYIKKNKPDLIILCAGRVGGILANSSNPIDFYYDNVTIGNNVIKSAADLKIKNLIYFGSSCIYPNNLKRKIQEDDLLKGSLEKTNEAYSLAKISCTKLCQSISLIKKYRYISVMPCNVYGPNDNFDKRNSHVMAALVSKFYEAKVKNYKKVIVWGTGKPRREFINSQDLAESILFIINSTNKNLIINIGVGYDLSINSLAKKIANLINFKGKIIFDSTKPDGTYQKLLDNNKILNLGWKPKINLDDGIKEMINYYEKKYVN